MKACLVTFSILLVFTLLGRYLFTFFGISVDGFRIVGGIIIFKIGYDMLQAHFSNVRLNAREQQESYSDDISITPLAIPMLCGPGAITSCVSLMADADDIAYVIALLITLAIVCTLSFIILCTSSKLLDILGETGNNVLMRLMGLILMVIAVECFMSGLKPIVIDTLKAAGI